MAKKSKPEIQAWDLVEGTISRSQLFPKRRLNGDQITPRRNALLTASDLEWTCSFS